MAVLALAQSVVITLALVDIASTLHYFTKHLATALNERSKGST